MDSEQETLGYLRGKVETLEREMVVVRADLTTIRTLLDLQRGGWKMLFALTSTAAALGAALTAIVEWFTRK